jgi:autotransporter adhesin
MTVWTNGRLGAGLVLAALLLHSALARAQITDPVQVPSGCVANVADQQLACGQGATTAGSTSRSTAVGINAQSDQFSAAFGASAVATGIRSTAVGDGATTFGFQDSTVIGSGATAGGARSTVLGGSATTANVGAIAVGFNAGLGLGSGQYSIAMGSGATAPSASHAIGNFSVAIGSGDGVSANGAISNAAFGTAIGASSIAQNQFDAAFGAFSIASGSRSAAFGANSVAAGASSVAMGDTAFAQGSNAVAVGRSAVAAGTNSVVLGAGASAVAANSVAIGFRSEATAANTASFGTPGNERRLTNVAAGINPTDAVNVGQLTALTAGLQSQISNNRSEARRGIAAAVATASAPMPSAPGKTTWQLRGSTFQSEYGVGFGFAHRLPTAMPLNVVGGYGNGGGAEHTGYVGLGGEF